MWFETLTGFREEDPELVRSSFVIEGSTLTSRINGRVMNCGVLETPSLAELRQRVEARECPRGSITAREVVANVQHLHADPANAGALFQVASQFNLLEMTGPETTPEEGVGIYEYDRTQGPACAIAAGAGTIYRNYFAPVNGRVGQSATSQIDCLADIGHALGNRDGSFWQMQNGYALATEKGLREISDRLESSTDAELDELRQLLRIGIQWQTEVTLDNAGHTVSQAYCSALPVAYSMHDPDQWACFARLVLEASYEATIHAGLLNYHRTGNNRLFLTFIGGGAFGNKTEWIFDAILRALKRNKHFPLDIVFVSHRSPGRSVERLVREIENM